MFVSLKKYSGEHRKFAILDAQKEHSEEYRGHEFVPPAQKNHTYKISVTEIDENEDHPIRLRRKKSNLLKSAYRIKTIIAGEIYTELEKSLIDKWKKICKGTDMELSQYQAILVKSLDILSEREERELDTLLDNDSTTTQDVLDFLKSRIPTFDLLVKEIKHNTLVTA